MSSEIKKKKKEEKRIKREFNSSNFWVKIMATALVIVMVVAASATLIYAII